MRLFCSSPQMFGRHQLFSSAHGINLALVRSSLRSAAGWLPTAAPHNDLTRGASYAPRRIVCSTAHRANIAKLPDLFKHAWRSAGRLGGFDGQLASASVGKEP
jgi:hypothetical protein